MIRILVLFAVLGSAAAFAQTDAPPPPPLIEAPPPTPTDAPKKDETAKTNEAPTPPPPGAHLPNSQTQTGYPYSPYGAPLTPPKEPPREVGLIITEYLFGTLTAAPIVLLPYVLFLRDAIAANNNGALDSQGASLTNILFLVIFASVPIAIAQTEIGIANGSRFYEVEGWTAYLSGLVGQAGVLGLYYLIGSSSPAAEPILLGGTILFVPAIETAALNLTKQPKGGMGGFGLINHTPGRGWAVSRPQLLPLFTRDAEGLHVGLQVPVMAGRF